MNWQLDVDPTPALLVLPPAAASLDEAHAAIEMWEYYSGKTLDSTQRLAVEVMMAESSSGKWAAATTGREMPRQNGKGDEIEVVEFWGLVQRAESILHTVHDAVLLASQAQQRMLLVLERPDLRTRIKRKWMGTGQQMIELRNGGVIWYRTRTGGGGRGVDDISRLVIDEAQHATEEHLAAVAPTMLANPNPQLNAMGTSALAGRSDWWWSVRIRALGADPGSFGFVGHTAEDVHLDDAGELIQPPIDPADRRLWHRSNPAIKRKPDVLEFLEEQFRVLGPASFAREHLGVWDPPESHARSAKIPGDLWAALPRGTCPHGRVVIAFDVDLDGEHASISVIGGHVARPYFECVRDRHGTGWLAAELVGLVQRNDPIAVAFNAAGPAKEQAGAVMVAFREAGISTDLLMPVGAGDYRACCGALLSHVREGTLTLADAAQQPLDLAASDATERQLAEGWVFDRRQATVPISPLVACTVGLHLLPTEAQPVAVSDFIVV